MGKSGMRGGLWRMTGVMDVVYVDAGCCCCCFDDVGNDIYCMLYIIVLQVSH